MSITRLQIKNFRSIANFDSATQGMNIFVGQNDEGKSNVLRALNLFFNGDSRHGFLLDWKRDYCAFAPVRKNKAEEISITVEITPPATFKDRTPLRWTKVWRNEGIARERMRLKSRDKIPSKSKIVAYAKALRYDYVPAIKGEEYFQSLMANLHDMLESTVEAEVRRASQQFTAIINENTQMILDGILEKLSLESEISLPDSLRDIFAQLEFVSNSEQGAFSLSQRGDGIKVRHIPIVLRWLAEQANILSAPGKPKTATIWGYEEPENNLELGRCSDLAQQFVDNASSIQVFVTTHSPAFYAVARENDPAIVKLFLVQKQVNPAVSNFSPIGAKDLHLLDTSMGFLELLRPHMLESRKTIDLLRQRQRELTDTNVPTLFCEGPSDKALLEAALAEFRPDLSSVVSVRCNSANGGGHSWVADMLIAWSYNRPQAHAVGLFDKDEGAKLSRGSVRNKSKPSGSSMVHTVELLPDSVLKSCFAAGFVVPHAIEELLPEDVWDHAEQNNWLEPRPDPVSLYKFGHQDISFNDYVEKKLNSSHQKRIVLWKLKSDPKVKKALCDFVLFDSTLSSGHLLSNLKPIVDAVLNKLDLA